MRNSQVQDLPAAHAAHAAHAAAGSPNRWLGSALILCFALIGTLGWTPLPASAAGVPLEQLRQRVTEHFDVLVLRSGVVLKPLAETGYRSVEIHGRQWYLDGDRVSRADLRERLGEDAALVEEIGALSESAQRELFSPSLPAAPPAPGEPATIEAPAAPSPPRSPAPPSRHRQRSDAKVSVGGSVRVEEGEVAEDVVAVGGMVEILGEVAGDAVAVGGSVTVQGRVTGDVVSVGGSVEVGPRAEILGNVASIGGKVVRREGAKIHGKVSEVSSLLNFSGLRGWRKGWGPGKFNVDWDDDDEDTVWRRSTHWVGKLIKVGVLLLLGLLAWLLVPRPIERMGRAIASEPWKMGLVGLVTQVLFVPLLFIVVIVLLVSIIGIPLLVLVPFAILAVVVGAFLGLVAVARELAAWSERRFGWQLASPYGRIAIGFVVIYAITLAARLLGIAGGPLHWVAAIFAFFGFLASYAAWTVGLGAALFTRLGTQEPPGTVAGGFPPVPPPIPAGDGAGGAGAEISEDPSVLAPPDESQGGYPR
jgi:hypothetical protein